MWRREYYMFQRFILNKYFVKALLLIVSCLIILYITYQNSLINILNTNNRFVNNIIDKGHHQHDHLNFPNRSLIENKIILRTGFNTLLSNTLPLNRVLPDVRDDRCKNESYSLKLPKVSIIIVSYNEEISIVLRTLHSIIKSTSEDLLQEIILVNDYSNSGVEKDLENYARENLPKIIKIQNLKKRYGLIKARLKGAKLARGKVLVFLDAHVEVNINWLPPLLEPLMENPKACTTPVVDVIGYDTFEYQPSAPSRGGFNWDFNYINLPLLPEEFRNLPKPHNNPIMSGGLFAIRRDFFWHLRGYDEGLEIWGGEQFELSFKIWLCGGKILEVPCSRVGHLYRSPKYHIKYTERKDDFISRNYKRVAEVWMDEYKEYLYEHIPKLTQIQEGDLTHLKLTRQKLHCKTFKWFLHNVAADLLTAYPPLEPNDYAQGAIQSLAMPTLCLDILSHKARQQLTNGLKSCSPDLQYPFATQNWQLSFRKDIRQQGLCLEVQSSAENAPLWLWNCHHLRGNQYWYYDRATKFLIQGEDKPNLRCLELVPDSLNLVVNRCDDLKQTMKWHFGYVNHTAMDRFYKEF